MTDREMYGLKAVKEFDLTTADFGVAHPPKVEKEGFDAEGKYYFTEQSRAKDIIKILKDDDVDIEDMSKERRKELIKVLEAIVKGSSSEQMLSNMNKNFWSMVILQVATLAVLGGLQLKSLRLVKKSSERQSDKLKDPLTTFKRELPVEQRLVNLDLRASEIDMALGMLREGVNVIFAGPPGCGKTACLYGLSDALDAGRFEELAPDMKLVVIGKGALVADTEHRSEFETRIYALRKQIETARSEGKRIVLGIDDLRNFLGAGQAKDTGGFATELLQDVSDGKVQTAQKNPRARRWVSSAVLPLQPASCALSAAPRSGIKRR